MKFLLLSILFVSLPSFSSIILETSMGKIEVELDHQNTPETAKNFERYVAEGFYDGLIFHRVIKNFMIQGGGLTPDLKQRATHDPIQHEGLHSTSNLRRTIAMARTSDPNSATGQFYINIVDNKGLDYKSPTPEGYGYVVFGKVIQGMEVVDLIKEVKTKTSMPYQDVPAKPVIIQKAYFHN
jgi:peptidyl-prolyl cis-trans isomerase B (cyclophilin B)